MYMSACWCCVSANDFGLFLADEDPKKGVWLDKKRNFEYYLLRNGVSLQPSLATLVYMYVHAHVLCCIHVCISIIDGDAVENVHT